VGVAPVGELSRLLSCYSADINAQDVDGSKALHAAAEAGQAEAVELLITSKADLNVRPSPIHCASTLCTRQHFADASTWRSCAPITRTRHSTSRRAKATLRQQGYSWQREPTCTRSPASAPRLSTTRNGTNKMATGKAWRGSSNCSLRSPEA
jgi:hypothetical protein